MQHLSRRLRQRFQWPSEVITEGAQNGPLLSDAIGRLPCRSFPAAVRQLSRGFPAAFPRLSGNGPGNPPLLQLNENSPLPLSGTWQSHEPESAARTDGRTDGRTAAAVSAGASHGSVGRTDGNPALLSDSAFRYLSGRSRNPALLSDFMLRQRFHWPSEVMAEGPQMDHYLGML